MINYILGILCVCLVTFAAYGENVSSIECVGMYRSGEAMHILIDIKTATINIDGAILKYNPKREHVSTEDYINKFGIYIYNAILPDRIITYNAATNEIIYITNIACHKNN